ncbi:heme ABC transporter ATP-binding protein [Methylobrevis albus]|uniref:Heme ABC transporter ATP-binding protein n=1 Tax=Methylobrevis albus TaxID=2793297 RepID=A0A931I1R9_9HYPH|nr:heme ABC transporter ATP-binding protein [Methylobrevis albus]MBH0237809.1 heme ABC transporter ATP-binding protein [Methylobrevis albus]
MIEAERLSYLAGGRRLIDDVDFTAADGAVTLIVGPNGAGKSTLLKLLTGELRPSAGRINQDGRDVLRSSAAELARWRAVLPQATTLAFPFTAGEIVDLGVRATGRPVPGRVAAALERVGLPDHAGRLYQTLSGGEQQRVQFARVLAQVWDPVAAGRARFLFLDEPTASLDIRHQIGLLEIARAHARAGGGVVGIVHDLNLAAEFADRLVVMAAGRIVAAGPPQATLTEAVVSEVFAVSGIVGRLPPPGIAYLLPQARRR